MRQKGNHFTKGFTLVEAVVAFALAAILFTSLMTVIAPAYRMYQRTRAQSDGQMIAGNLLDNIRTVAMNATELTASGSEVHIGRRNVFTVSDDKRLLYNGTPLYDEKYYNGKTISMEAEQAGENIIRVTIAVSGGGMPNVTQATAVIAPVRRILGETDAGAAGVLLAKAAAVKTSASGSNAGTLFATLYSITGGQTASFETYDIDQIISRAKLQTLADGAETAGASDAEKALLGVLLSAEKPFYLAVYYTQNSLIPIAYVTYVKDAANDASNPVYYYLYYGGNWYLRNPNYDTNTLDAFDNLSNTGIVNVLNAGDRYILAENVKLPMPRP